MSGDAKEGHFCNDVVLIGQKESNNAILLSSIVIAHCTTVSNFNTSIKLGVIQTSTNTVPCKLMSFLNVEPKSRFNQIPELCAHAAIMLKERTHTVVPHSVC